MNSTGVAIWTVLDGLRLSCVRATPKLRFHISGIVDGPLPDARDDVSGRRPRVPERLIELVCFPLRSRDDDLTRIPGHRIRRFCLKRQGTVGRIHFLDGDAASGIEPCDAIAHRYQLVTSASSPVPPGRPSLP